MLLTQPENLPSLSLGDGALLELDTCPKPFLLISVSILRLFTRNMISLTPDIFPCLAPIITTHFYVCVEEPSPQEGEEAPYPY